MRTPAATPAAATPRPIGHGNRYRGLIPGAGTAASSRRASSRSNSSSGIGQGLSHVALARDTQLATVPGGTWSIDAISAWV